MTPLDRAACRAISAGARGGTPSGRVPAGGYRVGVQTKYQVRFAWGAEGAARIADGAHLLVWIDVLPSADGDGDVVRPEPSLPAGPGAIVAGLGAGTAVADRVTALQTERGDRCVVAVVAAGPGLAVEDLLASGEVIDALAARGIDHSSPEAAAACAAFTGLRRAVRHLVSASESAVALDAVGRRDLVEAALAGPTVSSPAIVGPGREQTDRG